MPLPALFPIGSRRRKFIRQLLLDVEVPAHLAGNFRHVEGIASDVDLEEEEIGDTYAGRLAIARRHVVPWLDRARALQGCRVLEIGCGRGASTIALAEQGCQVTGVDVDQAALDEAKARCEKLGLTKIMGRVGEVDRPRTEDRAR